MTLIDSHAHLAEEVFEEDRPALLERARRAGVETVIVIGYDLPSSRDAIALAQEVGEGGAAFPALFATAGFAPHNVADADPEGRVAVRALLSQDRVVAVGEIGLDYHYEMPRAEQRRLYREQLGWAVEAGLPVVIHSREAEQDVLAGLRDAGAADGRLCAVIHCFTESAAMADAVVAMGSYVSFSGILTFGNAGRLRETAARVPLERTLIETDSPYLAPRRRRGRRNEPAYVGEVAQCLASVHGVSVEQVASVTAENCRRVFGLR